MADEGEASLPGGDGNETEHRKGANLEDIVDYFSGRGHPHPIPEGVNELRALLLERGFDELLTSYFIEAKDVKDLLGMLNPAFRDSIYYLNTVRMEPIAPSRSVEVEISRRFPSIDLAQLWNMLDDVDATTSGEDLLLSFKHDLGLTMEEAIDLMNMIPEISSASLQSTGLTLRAFMPISWLNTVVAVYDEKSLPMRLFTVGTVFRREPVLDRIHMRTYTLLSLAVFDKDLTIEKGISILKRLLSSMGIEEPSFIEKPYSYPFFELGTEIEVFIGDLEIGTCGMVSPDILGRSHIKTNLFLVDLGVERVLMYQKGYPDIRELFYPQFFSAWSITDQELAASIKYLHRPRTKVGREMARSVVSVMKAAKGREEKGPLAAWKGHLIMRGATEKLVSTSDLKEGEIGGIPAVLLLEEAKEGMGLYGPGAFDQIWVSDGNIIGVPPSLLKEMRRRGGLRTNKSYLKAFAHYVGWKVERSLSRGSTSKSFEMVRGLEDINMHLTSEAQNYVLSRSRKVDVKGPVFLRFRFVLGGKEEA